MPTTYCTEDGAYGCRWSIYNLSSYWDNDYYKSDEYLEVYRDEMNKLIHEITSNPSKIYLISKVGAGMANKFHIWEEIIEPRIKRELTMQNLENVEFLW